MSVELEQLRHEARPLGLYVGEHREYRDGPYFVARLGEHSGGGILKFATAEKVRALFVEYAKPGAPVKLPKGSDEDDELFTLRNASRPLGFYVGVHDRFDPCLGGGKYYLMHAKSSPLYAKHRNQPTVLKFATAEQVEEFLAARVENYAN